MEKRERKPNENIQVFVRLRPANAREKAIRSMDMVEVPTNRDVVLRNMTDTKLNKKFTFDRAFGPESKQNEVYAAVVGPMIEEVLSGYNCTVFAYGQTGTGKTHTMVGEEVPDLKNGWEDDNLVGMVPRAVNHLFDELRMMEMEFSMRVSYLELYNEECFDLLSPDDTTKIRIFEDKKGGIIVHGLEEIPVHSKNDVYKLLAKGQEKRRTAPTLMNAQSSRSHTIFSIVVHMKDQKAEGEEMLKIGKLNLVDLAGSENISKAGNEKGVRARETVNINQSLLTLGRVMTALVEHQPHVPYRESKLTRLLQESLGGRTKTSIIATISPGHKDYEETANTLDYAHRAKNIQNRPEVNQRLTKKTVIKEFTEEIDRLKRDLMAARNKDGVFLTEESYNELLVGQESTTKELNEKVVQIRALKEQMAEKEKLFTEVSLHLVEKTEELRTTQDNLRATGTELIHTQSKLQTTDEKYRQQRFLLKHHEHTERKLQTQAKDLMQVAETATTDVGGLHEMLERRRGVDAQNQSKMSQFPQRIEKHFQGFTGNAEHFRGEICREADSIKHQIDESVAEARKNSAILGEELTGLLTICKDMASQSMDMFAQLRKNSEAGWTEVVDAVEERYLVKQKDFESAFKDLFRGISASVEKQNAIVNRIGEQSDALNESVHKEIEDAEKEFAKLAQKEQTVSTALNEDMNAMQRLLGELQHKWSKMEDVSREKEKSRIDLLATTRDLQKKHAEQTEQIRMESQTAKAETLQILKDAVQLTEQRTHMTTSDFEDIRKLTTRQVEIGQQTEATVNQQMSVNVNGFNESLAKTNERMVSDLDRAAKNSEGFVETVTAINDKVGVFVKNYEDFAQDCVQVVRAFCQNEVETYRPTGETPSKKNFSYPKTLSQTSPHGRILQRFRYDPNNSFNSSTDILPGLDDSMVGANIDEGVEPKGEEEEDVAFEDAQEGGGSATTAAESPAWKLDQENGENENPNVQRKKRSTGSGPTKATNRPLLEVRQRDIIYVSSDDD